MYTSPKDKEFNYKIAISSLIAIILALLIGFYYSYSQYKSQIENLDYERELLIKDMTIMEAQISKLSGANELAEINATRYKAEIQQLQDSLGSLNFSILQLNEDRKALLRLEQKYDALLARTNEVLGVNNTLTRNYDQVRKELEALKGNANAFTQVESEARKKNLELSEALKTKKYLTINQGYGNALRMVEGKIGTTNKASVTEFLRGCVQLGGNSNKQEEVKILYLQFLDPDLKVIEDNNRVVNVAGNVYSKKLQLMYLGEPTEVCESISVRAGTLASGIYTLNVFENERLLSSSEFQLK